ncbi:uncharacterized protein MONOS_6931 [Monocercomonoides exilis]|uniref:uncharacterized protein n=1 Tax=Monocercomonoides exilis TaxID=2049356 RepID=UPI003559C7C9|nr:hypothetical protein MONOS_6931 [Monocercomonoides exilis]|eukprot:MONOS_6931.1-p1 / transcript=MONOS_6931.1 / gene=MONOS_6931 / organism=Monocercomonoides_exilis_PA203 / gene_product=unspecified product / transcript_product=unspecified product / location=Mono_scaffold00227:70992-71544(+) / protein_length=75 / sequence_SO=supercontig / SO=protein_coding / is_pseudo=false
MDCAPDDRLFLADGSIERQVSEKNIEKIEERADEEDYGEDEDGAVCGKEEDVEEIEELELETEEEEEEEAEEEE